MDVEITTPVLVSQMELVGDLYYWVRDHVLQEEGLRSHKALSLLRRIVLNGRLSFAELLRMTGATKYTVSRTAKFLVRSGLAAYADFDKRGTPHALKPTARGRRRLESMDSRLKEGVLRLIEASEGSVREKNFRKFLRLTDRYLPEGGLADSGFYKPASEPKAKPAPDPVDLNKDGSDGDEEDED